MHISPLDDINKYKKTYRVFLKLIFNTYFSLQFSNYC
jgi:hypothetical protein